MAQRAIDGTGADSAYPSSPYTTPYVGMRGGLGKTLLIAFLLLAIIPLSLLAILIYNRVQHDASQKLFASLDTMVALKEARLIGCVEGYERELDLLFRMLYPPDSSLPERNPESVLSDLQAATKDGDAALSGLILLDQSSGEVIATTDLEGMGLQDLLPYLTSEQRLNFVPPQGADGSLVLAVSATEADQRLVGLHPWNMLQQIVTDFDDREDGLSTYLVTREGLVVSARGAGALPLDDPESLPDGVRQALLGLSGSGSYTNLDGVPIFGVYHWNPELGVALLAEQLQTEALAAGNALAAVIVGATLVVALITTVIAAVVTRRITRPIVQLTQTAAWMARGDLTQEVTITRKDEIGVLARAFNRMAAELRVLYASLEAKVAERTRQLEEAKDRTSYYAMQLSLSAEVARVATSIRDVDELLGTVSRLIADAFELEQVSIYLLNDGDEWTEWQAGSGDSRPRPERRKVESETLVGRVAGDGQRRVIQGSHVPLGSGQNPESVACQMALPLRLRDRLLGVVDLHSSRPEDFDESDQMVYQSLAGQMSIAIENARVYAVERETVARLQELDRIQAEFLTNMSHALRTPLTSIIGFSRVMLKELDGPLTDLQRDDLTTVYDSGRQLLGLINDMLELTHLDLGTAPFAVAQVNLAEIVEGVMATARALAGNKPIQLYEEVPADLPNLRTDGLRVRQVILALLTNAVKYTEEGSIWLRVTAEDDEVTISINDTGVGIPREERDWIFSDTRHGNAPVLSPGEGPGFGLAISARVVERLGGRIWVHSEPDVGSTFTFTLPFG